MSHLTKYSAIKQLLDICNDVDQRISLKSTMLVVLIVGVMKLKRGYMALQCRGLEIYLVTAFIAIIAYCL